MTASQNGRPRFKTLAMGWRVRKRCVLMELPDYGCWHKNSYNMSQATNITVTTRAMEIFPVFSSSRRVSTVIRNLSFPEMGIRLISSCHVQDRSLINNHNGANIRAEPPRSPSPCHHQSRPRHGDFSTICFPWSSCPSILNSKGANPTPSLPTTPFHSPSATPPPLALMACACSI